MGWSFPIRVDEKTGKIKTTSLEEDIKQSVKILLNTVRGERLKHRNYGSQLTRFVFEPISYHLVREIEEELYETLQYWEPRIEDINIEILHKKSNDAELFIHISYTIIQTKTRDEINYEYSLSESNKTTTYSG